MSQEEVKNKLKTLTQGSKGEKVIDNMARTFKTLCEYADWSEDFDDSNIKYSKNIEEKSEPEYHSELDRVHNTTNNRLTTFDLNYNIQIHLPETSNMSVYDAIFQSLKKHLM